MSKIIVCDICKKIDTNLDGHHYIFKTYWGTRNIHNSDKIDVCNNCYYALKELRLKKQKEGRDEKV